MLRRFKNGFAVLVALLVFGVSSQGAVCAVACVSSVPQSCCQPAADAMASHGVRCPGDMTSSTGVKAHLQSESACNHFVVLAVEQSASTGVSFGDVQWSVVEVVPAEIAMSGRERAASKSPPLRFAWTDPLLVSLRV